MSSETGAGTRTVIADQVAADRRGLTALPHRELVVHFDVDVLDALDLPLGDIATCGTGLRLDHVEALLRTLLADPRVVGMTVIEANPDHDPDGTSIRRPVAAVAAAPRRHDVGPISRAVIPMTLGRQ
jgi:arginase family enzyme